VHVPLRVPALGRLAQPRRPVLLPGLRRALPPKSKTEAPPAKPTQPEPEPEPAAPKKPSISCDDNACASPSTQRSNGAGPGSMVRS